MKQIQFFWIGRWEPELNQILSMISNRNSENSCNKNHFDKTAPDYNIALKNSGFNVGVAYVPTPSKRQIR